MLISNLMNLFRRVPIAIIALFLSACAYPMRMTSLEGEKFAGRYRFGREDTGLIQIYGPENEMLIGQFARVGRTDFVQNYEKTFGRGTIELDGSDLSRHSATFGGMLGTSSTFHETAYSDPVAAAAGKRTKVISGPLFYWVASLQGDRRSVLGCFLIGSSYTGSGFGRCKNQSGREFLVDF